jgi:hypothetical protein
MPDGRAAIASLTDAVVAIRPVLQDVDVHVIGMRRVGPRPEHRREPPACGDADGIDRGTQMLIPIGLDGQRSAIRELEARDVGRETGRVRADLSGRGTVAGAAFVTRPGANRLEFDRELAGNERSDEVAQPMAEPFTEPAGKRRFIGQADRRSPPRRQFDGLKPHGRLDSASRFGGRWKLDRLEFDFGGAETIHIADQGGIYNYHEMLALVRQWGGDPLAELGGKSNRGSTRCRSFISSAGRDFTVSYFGANIYPENVSVGLEQPGLRDWVSGKFVLQVTETIDRDKALSVVIELAAGVAGNEQMAWTIANAIHQELLRLNSEFANYVPAQHQMPLY